MRDISYAGKRVVITGAYSGIGAALIEVLRELGADNLTVLDLKSPVTHVEQFIQTDMGNPVSIDAAVAAIGADVDVLFNNAGIAATRPAEQVMRVIEVVNQWREHFAACGVTQNDLDSLAERIDGAPLLSQRQGFSAADHSTAKRSTRSKGAFGR